MHARVEGIAGHLPYKVTSVILLISDFKYYICTVCAACCCLDTVNNKSLPGLNDSLMKYLSNFLTL